MNNIELLVIAGAGVVAARTVAMPQMAKRIVLGVGLLAGVVFLKNLFQFLPERYANSDSFVPSLITGTLVAYGLRFAAYYLSERPAYRAWLFNIWRAGFVFNENTGAYQPIVSRGINGPIVTTKPRAKRGVEEVERRRQKWVMAVILYPCLVLGIHGHYSFGPEAWMQAVLFGVPGVVMLIYDGLYLAGAQIVPGAMVIDPPAVLPKFDDPHGPPVGGLPDTGGAVPLDEYRPNT